MIEVGPNPAQGAAANYADNLCRWNGRSAGHYEVWFLTLNHRPTGRGFGIRYVLEAPATSKSLPGQRAAVWASLFDRAAPERHFALRQSCGIEQFAFAGEAAFSLRVGDAEFAASRVAGALSDERHQLAWDLNFSPNSTTYHHIPRRLSLLARPTSQVCTPNLDARFSGTVMADGEELIFADEPGCQVHLWGRKRVDEWIWAHCNAFERYPDTAFEGLLARPHRASHGLLPVNSLLLRHRGEEHQFVRLRFNEHWQKQLGIGYWSFEASNTKLWIDGVAQCRLRDMLQVAYLDPDGEPLYCLNSEIAHLKIRLFRRAAGLRWRHVETLHAHATTHLEYAARAPEPLVRMAFE